MLQLPWCIVQVLTIGATNLAQELDQALLRPGRFEVGAITGARQISQSPPSFERRAFLIGMQDHVVVCCTSSLLLTRTPR